MKHLPKEVFSEVLSCLDAREIASITTSNRSIYRLAQDMGSLASYHSFRKPVSIHDLHTKYANHFIFVPAPFTDSAVTFRYPPLLFRSLLSRKLFLHILTILGEYDAARWVARHGAHPVPDKSTFPHILLYQTLPWDFWTYSTLCKSVEMSSSPTMRLHIRSIPGVMNDDHRLLLSPQPLLSNLLWHARHKLAILKIHGVREMSTTTVTQSWIQEERRKIDKLFKKASWGQGVRLFNQYAFKSSTISLGMVLMTVNPRLHGLHIANYTFDEWGPSKDARYLTTWFSNGQHETLTRIHLHGLSFSHGIDFCNVMRGLCRIESLRHLWLSSISYFSNPPVDPIAILFAHGGHLNEVRIQRAARPPTNMPFHLLTHTTWTTLKLSHMVIDSTAIPALTTVLLNLHHLATLDLSSNGMDGDILALFADVLASPLCRLERLNLSANTITSASIAPFCIALRKNNALCSLNLSHNFLGTQSSLLLIRTMVHSTLKLLHLDSNQVRVTVEDLYAELPTETKSDVFRQITLRHNPLDKDGLTSYKTLFKKISGISFTF